MKKIFIILSATVVFVACGSNDTSKNESTTETKTEETPSAPATTAANAEADKGLELIAKSDCLTCHKVADKLVGPAYEDVAAKYTADEATIDSLASKIIKGGAGNWGQVPMTPHPNVSTEDAKTMVKYVLSLKK